MAATGAEAADRSLLEGAHKNMEEIQD